MDEQIELVASPLSQMRQDARADQILAHLFVRPPRRELRQPNAEQLTHVGQVLLEMGNDRMSDLVLNQMTRSAVLYLDFFLIRHILEATCPSVDLPVDHPTDHLRPCPP